MKINFRSEINDGSAVRIFQDQLQALCVSGYDQCMMGSTCGHLRTGY